MAQSALNPLKPAQVVMRTGENLGVNQEINQATEQSIDKFLIGSVL